jgi:hypothetical protein
MGPPFRIIDAGSFWTGSRENPLPKSWFVSRNNTLQRFSIGVQLVETIPGLDFRYSCRIRESSGFLIVHVSVQVNVQSRRGQIACPDF